MTDTEKAALEQRIDELCQENEQLRQRITTQKQTIQSYRDESREWREVADHANDENTKLRELCGSALVVIENNCSQCAYFYECNIDTDCKCLAPMRIRDELRELGSEAKQ